MQMTSLSMSLLVMVLFGLTGLSAAEPLTPGKEVVWEFHPPQATDAKDLQPIKYWLFLPANYVTKEAWPLMLFLHGAGERGDDIELVKQWGPPKRVIENPEFPFILISPQCQSGKRWNPDYLPTLAHLVDELAGKLRVDKERMYVTGLSMGGRGTWGMITKYPKLFAAAAPICGGGNPELAPRVKNIPIWAFHGDADRTVPLAENQEMVEAVNQSGGEAKLTIYPGVGHNSWSETYANPKLYEWLLSHTR
jgi:predicted peptidase